MSSMDRLTQRARQALRAAQDEARRLGHASAQQVVVDAHTEADERAHHCVGTEHVLLGLVHRANAAGTMLAGLGAPPDAIRSAVLRAMRQGPPARR